MTGSGNGSRLWVFIQYSQFVGRDKDKVVEVKILQGPRSKFLSGRLFLAPLFLLIFFCLIYFYFCKKVGGG